MGNITSALIIDNLSNLLLCCALLLALLPKKHLILRMILLSIVGIFICCWQLVEGNNVLSILRGITSNSSISTLLVLVVININLLFNLKITIINRVSAIIMFITGVILYSTSLGLIPLDIYDLGFMPNIYYLVLLLVVLLIIATSNRLLAVILLIACFAYYFHLQASINLWDYLFNPLLWIIAIIYLVIDLFNNCNKLRQLKDSQCISRKG
jgi:hypothetical protein